MVQRRATDLTVRELGSIPGRIFSFLHRVQTVSGADPVFYLTDAGGGGGFLSWSEAAGA
jgi:hypothetical protein